jgi:Ca-activated chloride channel family protein
MRFAYPWVFFLLVLIPVFFRFWQRKQSLPPVRLQIFGFTPPGSRWPAPSTVQTVLKAVALAFLLVALARPQSISKTQERKANGVDIVMVLDVSLSMLIQDMGDATRMEIAKETFKQFIEGRSNDRIGFVMFSGEPITLAPPTLDYGLLLSQLRTVEPGGNGLRDGTAIGDGLALAINRLKKSSAKSRIVILLTDGDNNVGRIDPITAGELAQGYAVKVYSIAIGTEGRVKQPLPVVTPLGKTFQHVWVENRLNPTLLAQISEKTQGKFYRVQDEQALIEVFRDIDRLEKTEIITRDKLNYHEEFLPWVYAALFCLLTERILAAFWWRQWA